MTVNKKISIEPLARVEGHGGITVEIKDSKITDVKVNILEGPRLFERLVVGKTPEEVSSIAPRICAICNLSLEKALLWERLQIAHIRGAIFPIKERLYEALKKLWESPLMKLPFAIVILCITAKC